jgi:hypothetical protein
VLVIRSAAALTVGTVLFLCLGGCTPGRLPVAAVRAVDGRPVLLLAPCPGFTPDRISVFAEGTAVDRSWVLDRTDGAVPAAVTLFRVPPGWTPVRTSLTDLQAGTRYGVRVSGVGGEAVTVRFTTDRLATLGAGQVLVGDPPSGWRAVPEQEFRERAAESCG